MYCSQCGTQSNPEARFCSVCGTPMAGGAPDVRATLRPTGQTPETAVPERQTYTHEGSELLGVLLLLAPLVSTALIIFWVGNMALIQGPASTLMGIMCLTVLGTAVLVAAEASQIGVGSLRDLDKNGRKRSGPVAWFFVLTLLWLIGYPMYMGWRSRYGRKNLIVGGVLVALVFVGTAGAFAVAIEKSREQLLGGLNAAQRDLSALSTPPAARQLEPTRTPANAPFRPRLLSFTSPESLVAAGWRFPTENDKTVKVTWKGQGEENSWTDYERNNKEWGEPFHVRADFDGDGVTDDAWLMPHAASETWGLFVFLQGGKAIYELEDSGKEDVPIQDICIRRWKANHFRRTDRSFGKAPGLFTAVIASEHYWVYYWDSAMNNFTEGYLTE